MKNRYNTNNGYMNPVVYELDLLPKTDCKYIMQG